MLLSVIMHQCVYVLYLGLSVPSVRYCAWRRACPSHLIPEQRRSHFHAHEHPTDPAPSLITRPDYSERVKTIGGESHGNSCKLVPHLIVGVLDDSVEGGHQGLLQVEAAGVAGDFGVWQCLEENHQQEFAVKELCNWRFTRHCLMIFKN